MNETLSNQTGRPIIEHKESDYNEQYGQSPIYVRGNKELGYFATIGDQRITEDFFDTPDDVEDFLSTKNWTIS